MMHPNEVIALGFHYPAPASASELSDAIDDALNGEIERHMRRFAAAVSELPLGRWEELHTSTCDLNPKFIPYVGHVIWGENYRRGAFMADLNAEMKRVGIDLRGELPDHIEPILRYLAVCDSPLQDLVEVLPRALDEMEKALRKESPDSPYCHLLAATVACAGSIPVTIGAK